MYLLELSKLELTILDDVPSAEVTLLFVVYGICGLTELKELALNNFKV